MINYNNTYNTNENADAIFQDILADAFLYDLETQSMFFNNEEKEISQVNQINNSTKLTNNHKSASLMASQKLGGQNHEI
jgi:hypothetical protein